MKTTFIFTRKNLLQNLFRTIWSLEWLIHASCVDSGILWIKAFDQTQSLFILNPFDSESVPQNESITETKNVTDGDTLTESVSEKASELAEWVAGPAAENKYENSASDKYGERIDTGDGGDNSGSKFTVGQGMGDTGYSGSGGASRPDFQYQRWVILVV